MHNPHRAKNRPFGGKSLSAPRYERIVVTACMTRQGTPAFVLTRVAVTEDEIQNGVQYALTESQLFIDGYEEPFVHFDQDEAPSFLIPAVREQTNQMSIDQPVLVEAT